MWQVTYYNEALEQRCVLVDKLDFDTAMRLLVKFGSVDDHLYYLGPDVKVEEMPTEQR